MYFFADFSLFFAEKRGRPLKSFHDFWDTLTPSQVLKPALKITFTSAGFSTDHLSKGAVLNTRPQKGKQRKKEKGVPNLGRTNPRSKLGTPLVM